MYIRLKVGKVAESDEVRPGVVFDFDADGKVLGIEMLDVSAPDRVLPTTLG